ncbi:hypothetical protein SLEP1_g53818 [Rubroshorea leprosula]|uniref:Uncharacterized protein n=1 Tax=Rubroshorea leprosula TaxID=152421 RepID=A0AAV5MEE9_9ROSI|nr:hypothetical protein SLEP1_g53818 [Rubroshorea leprosula]
MSFEETLSVGGSEEVRALEYGDVGIESGWSGLERTKGEVGREEMVKGEEEGIPLNVLEVEGGGDKCYDREADIVSEVMGYKSELVTRDSLNYLVDTYALPYQVLIRSAGVEEKACSVPRDHWMPMYAHYLAVGLRFPILKLLVGLLLEYNIGLTQLVPNAVREEEVEKLVREGDDILNIMYLTSLDVIEAAELYGPSSLREAEMDKFLSSAGGIAITKKPRKKSKTFENVGERAGDREREKISRSEDLEPAQKKKKKVGELEVRGDKVVEFVPRPPLVELDPELRETRVTTHGKGKELVPSLSLQSSLFDAKNTTAAKRFINSTFPEVDRRRAREEVLTHAGATVVQHALEVC